MLLKLLVEPLPITFQWQPVERLLVDKIKLTPQESSKDIVTLMAHFLDACPPSSIKVSTMTSQDWNISQVLKLFIGMPVIGSLISLVFGIFVALVALISQLLLGL